MNTMIKRNRVKCAAVKTWLVDYAVREFIKKAAKVRGKLRNETVDAMKANPDALCDMLRGMFPGAPDESLLGMFKEKYDDEDDLQVERLYLAPFLRALLTDDDESGRHFLGEHAQESDMSFLVSASKSAEMRDGVYAFGVYFMSAWWGELDDSFTYLDWWDLADGLLYIDEYPLAMYCYMKAIHGTTDVKIRSDIAFEASRTELDYNSDFKDDDAAYNYVMQQCSTAIAPILKHDRMFELMHGLAMARWGKLCGKRAGERLAFLVDCLYDARHHRADSVPEEKALEFAIGDRIEEAFEDYPSSCFPEEKAQETLLTECEVNGTESIPQSEEKIENLDPDDELELRRESDNKYDRNAIAVYHGEDKLGYLPCNDNVLPARFMDSNRSLACRMVNRTNKSLKVAVYLAA